MHCRQARRQQSHWRRCSFLSLNIEATGHACLLVDHYGQDWSALWWLRLDGHGRVVADPVEASLAIDALVSKYRQYAEHRPSGPVLAVDITRWSSWSEA